MIRAGIVSESFVNLFLLMVCSLLLISSPSSETEAKKFHVGGKEGWILKPSEDYNHWAAKLRFQVNDTVHFKYNKGSDSVLVVKRDDYDSCNVNNPMQRMDDGDSTFKLSNSGPYFFISGNVENCKNGEKLIVLVMAVRHKVAPPPASDLMPREVERSSLVPAAHAPSKANSASVKRVGVGFGVGLVMMYLCFGAWFV
ncbi:hypothetical protein TanjilG_03038 [Lupinus angustifolius]|uniref:Phytocyanin domain-containing protein n=1 Tax=Lupinus angustifolius TaxID=3871 RepID=A0A4P1RCP8_LUPAN|nr:PREDICTED: early nodulin-like protein 2 [Lupinus angustifolius]OIW08362.1 hypothetical protein TanjilG_03038 [Lupinus angustifolius]